MDIFEEMQELEDLQNKFRALEDKACLTAIMEQAQEGRLVPLGAFGDKATPQEYFAHEHDYLRKETRGAYFSVKNKEARKELIAAQRKVESHIRRHLKEDVFRANRELSLVRAKTQQQPWGIATIVSVGAVALGYWAFGIVGAIGGAVGGLFLGLGVISRDRSDANNFLAHATHDLEQAEKEKEENTLMPEFLSHGEEIS